MPQEKRPLSYDGNGKDGSYVNDFRNVNGVEKQARKKLEVRHKSGNKKGKGKSDSSTLGTAKIPQEHRSEKPEKEVPKTPSPLSHKAPKYSEPTPDSTSKKLKFEEDNGKEGNPKCLFDFVEEEIKEYIRKLESVVSSRQKYSAKELNNSGDRLMQHAKKIKDLGKLFVFISKDHFNTLEETFECPSPTDQ